MLKEELMTQDEISIYVVFRVKDNLFSINGQYVSAIQQMPEKLMDVPRAASYVRGSYSTWGTVFTVVDLRQVFDWQTSREAFQAFSQMIDARKQDHTNWVETLKACRKTGEPFTLARDCHQCNLGRWRDNYHVHVQSVNHLLRELDGPHEELHHIADEVLRTDEEGDRAMERLEGQLMPRVLTLLDRMKAEFQEVEFREMLLVLQGDARIALTVDEVLSVESLEQVDAEGTLMAQPEVSFVRGIRRRVGQEELIMELDIPLLTERMDLGETAH